VSNAPRARCLYHDPKIKVKGPRQILLVSRLHSRLSLISLFISGFFWGVFGILQVGFRRTAIMKSIIVESAYFLSLVSSAFGNAAPFARVHAAEPVASIDIGAMANLATFDQLIDHNNPSLGTFKQRYWYSTEYWNATLNGAPVIYPPSRNCQFSC